jgi:AcrR family transcriptional regulator
VSEDQVSGRARERTDRWKATHVRILEAARGAFSNAGYSGANTIQIADAAQVTERTLFRHFPSKALLFEEAVVSPFHDYIDGYVVRWQAHEPGTLDTAAAVEEFFAEFLEFLERNRGLIIALVAAREFDDRGNSLFPTLSGELAGQLSGLEGIMAAESQARDFPLDPAVLTRMLFGLVLAVAVHGDWLFGPSAQPARGFLLDQMTRFAVHGLSRDDPPA